MTPEQRKVLEDHYSGLEVKAALAEIDRLKAENLYLLQGIERLTRDNDGFLAGQESERAVIATELRRLLDLALPAEVSDVCYGRREGLGLADDYVRSRGHATPTPIDEVLARLERMEAALREIADGTETGVAYGMNRQIARKALGEEVTA